MWCITVNKLAEKNLMAISILEWKILKKRVRPKDALLFISFVPFYTNFIKFGRKKYEHKIWLENWPNIENERKNGLLLLSIA